MVWSEQNKTAVIQTFTEHCGQQQLVLFGVQFKITSTEQNNSPVSSTT